MTEHFYKRIRLPKLDFSEIESSSYLKGIDNILESVMGYSGLGIGQQTEGGTVEEVLNKYRDLYDKLNEYRNNNYNSMNKNEQKVLTTIIENVSKAINEINKKYGESITQYKEFLNNRLKYDEQYSDVYGKILAARAELEEAYTKGDSAGVEAAKQKLTDVYNEALDVAKNDPTHQQGITKLIQEDLKEAQGVADGYSIKLKFDTNDKELKEKVQEIITSMGDITSTDLKNMFDSGESTEQLTKLKELLDANGISADNFKNSLDVLGFTFRKSC